jgi:H+/Cl- antiporter ClcA
LAFGAMDNRTFRADDRLNELNDRDDMWGPLLFLRPKRHQLLTPARALTICALLGGFFGMFGNVILRLLLHMGAGYRPAIWLMPGLLTAMYFVCGQVSLVAAWNRRARLLSRRLDWAELTGRPLPSPRDDRQPAD